jgi:cysteine-rich repeat protein
MTTSRWESVVALAVGLATPALGAIDFGGNWIVQQAGVLPFSVPLPTAHWQVTQAGTVVTVHRNGGTLPDGSIDTTTGDFFIDLGPTITEFETCPHRTITGTVAADGQTFTGTQIGYFFKVTPPAGCFQTSMALQGERTSCGNGSVDAGEDCDDGNLVRGDCCSASCRFEAMGGPCGGGECPATSCDGAGACVNQPATTCGTTCHPGTCNAGSCVLGSAAPEGTACNDDDDACTADACSSGFCLTQGPIECAACQQCDHVLGCRERTAGAVCRTATGECDLAEVCDGASPQCPTDALSPSGTPCTNGLCDGMGTCEAPTSTTVTTSTSTTTTTIPTSKCASKLFVAAGKHAGAKTKCYAKALKAGVPVDQTCLAKAESKFAIAFARAQTQSDCVTSATVDQLRSDVDTLIEALKNHIAP